MSAAQWVAAAVLLACVVALLHQHGPAALRSALERAGHAGQAAWQRRLQGWQQRRARQRQAQAHQQARELILRVQDKVSATSNVVQLPTSGAKPGPKAGPNADKTLH